MHAGSTSRTLQILASTFSALSVVALQAAAQGQEPTIPDDQLETPAQIWQRCQESLLPFNYEIEKDEVVPSDTRPDMQLRRVEVKFYSQELEGKKWAHRCVVYVPADKSLTEAPDRIGKCIIVGQRTRDGLVRLV